MKTITRPPVINRTRFRSYVEDYSAQRFPKEVILLHFPAALSAQSICKPWVTPRSRRCSRSRSPYVLDPDGSIYEMYQPEFWAPLRGVPSDHTDAMHERRTIAIDIVNAGPLRVDPVNPNQLNWWPNHFGARFCGIEETEKYVETDRGTPHRFAAFPEPQMAALRFLVDKLRREFNIPAVVPPPAKRWHCDPDYFLNYRGIASRHNFLAGHFETNPIFDWGCLGT